ncbi:MAG: rod-determining factor RdfA [Haloarculaceae archaeon]
MADRKGCKVDHTIHRYAVSAPPETDASLDEYLVARWTGAHGEDAVGYKELTAWFNKRVLARALQRADSETRPTALDGEYAALTGDDEDARAAVAEDLADAGVDVEAVRRDMVSWSTMRRHLKECLDAEKQTATADTDWERDSVAIARERLQEKVQTALGSLATKARLPEATKADVDVQVTLSCPECPTRVQLVEAVDRGYVCERHFETAETRETEEADERISLRDASGAVLPLGFAATALGAVPGGPVDVGDLLGSGLGSLVFDVGVALPW